jgi:integrase
MTMAEKLIHRGRTWYYRLTLADGRRVMRKGCSDKRETERMRDAAEIEQAKIRAGLVDPKELACRDHEARPIHEHLTDWHAYLSAKGSTRQHALLSRNRAYRVIELARVSRISDLAPSKVQAALRAIRDEGISLQSLHHYKRAIKGFSRWLWKDGRASSDDLVHLTSPNPDADRRHERRALTGEELIRLIQAAEAGPVVYTVTGPDRAALYRVALGTGFRANELRSLTPESFDLGSAPPTVTVKAAYSKRRRDDVQPIRPDLADSLRPWIAQKAPGRLLWGHLTKHTADMLRHDLEAAGIAYRDADGRVADFHALRHSYISMLARRTAPVKVVQTLARHSTPSLTLGIYSHIGVYDQTAALDALPDLTRPAPDSEPARLAMTGTDASSEHTLAPSLLHSGDARGRTCAPVDVVGSSRRGDSTPPLDGAQSQKSQELDASVR